MIQERALWIVYGDYSSSYDELLSHAKTPTLMVKPLQYIPRNMHTVFALLCFVVVIHWLIFPYPSGLLHWHCGNLTIVPVPAKQPWWIWINTPCEFIMNDCITTTKQSTTKPCAYFLGYTVRRMLYETFKQNSKCRNNIFKVKELDYALRKMLMQWNHKGIILHLVLGLFTTGMLSYGMVM